MLDAPMGTEKLKKIVTRIVWKAATTKKKIIVKWIPVHVEINGNEKADEFAKKKKNY
jgi:ribonuclease HI